MATPIVESNHAGEFLLGDYDPKIHGEQVTILSGQVLKAGHVLGKVEHAVTAPVGAADAGNTGDGTIGTLTVGTGVKLGVYKAVIIEPGTNLGTFQVEDPDGVIVGTGVVGTAFSGPVNFTIADGSADFVAGDFFTITVSAGSQKYVEYDPTNNDGSQVAVAILYEAVDATGADAPGVAVVRGPIPVNGEELVWFTGATSNQKDTGKAELKLVGIIAH